MYIWFSFKQKYDENLYLYLFKKIFKQSNYETIKFCLINLIIFLKKSTYKLIKTNLKINHIQIDY